MIEDEVIELKAQLEILQTKIRIKEQRLMNKIQIVKEMEWAQEKEIEVSIPERATYSIQQTREESGDRDGSRLFTGKKQLDWARFLFFARLS